jgi:hypothetical protein
MKVKDQKIADRITFIAVFVALAAVFLCLLALRANQATAKELQDERNSNSWKDEKINYLRWRELNCRGYIVSPEEYPGREQ